MDRSWLWDRKTSLGDVRKILNNPDHRNFTLFASLLLARNNEPGKVFREYINPKIFCKHWSTIKRVMRKDQWNSQRIIFWQAVYEELLEKYRKKGMRFREKSLVISDAIIEEIGSRIRIVRKEQGLSQKDLAKKLGISQQVISRIEKGKENISLLTLNNVVKALGRKVEISII